MPSMLSLLATLASVVAAVPRPQDDGGHCFPLSPGYGPVPAEDTPSAFSNLKDLTTAATSASTPSGYFRSFQNQAYTYNDAALYAGYTELRTYDTQACANLCNSTEGCTSFQIFFERNPLQAPGAACPNPASTTRIKCNVYTGEITDAVAKNDGHNQDDFQVVIAGSNAYTKDVSSSGAPFTIPGFQVDTYASGGAIEAPLDCDGNNTFVGSKTWNDGKIQIQRCIDTCLAEKRCRFINTFIERQDGVPGVQNCALYTAHWPDSYATNAGQFRGNDKITVINSYGLTLNDGAGTREACLPEA